MVDCKHAMKHLNEVKARWVVNEAVEQVAYADRIILNKVYIVIYRRFKRVSTSSSTSISTFFLVSKYNFQKHCLLLLF